MGNENVTSTRAKVDVEKASQILSKYELRDIEFLLDKDGYLQAVGESDSYESSPCAVLVTELPNKEDYDDEEHYWEEVLDIFYEEGPDGFTALLQELASCIETPMMILAAWQFDRYSKSSFWRIEPGCVKVEELEAYQ